MTVRKRDVAFAALVIQMASVALLFLAIPVALAVFTELGRQWHGQEGHAGWLAVGVLACYAAGLLCFWIGGRHRAANTVCRETGWSDIFRTGGRR